MRGLIAGEKPMKRLRKLVTFSLDDRKFALYVSAVQRIIRVVEVTALPKAPEIVVGIINMQGQVIPVFDIRMRFHLPAREVQLNDQMIIATTAKRTVALIVDSVDDVIEIPGERIIAAEADPSGTGVCGRRHEDGRRYGPHSRSRTVPFPSGGKGPGRSDGGVESR